MKKSRNIPLIIVVSMIVGLAIGTFYASRITGNRLGVINASSNKIGDLLRIVDDQYVDSIDVEEVVEKVMPQILSELDPHSMYIPAKDLEDVNAELKGSFSGIGIQFTIQHDSVHVNSVIPGGPSEKVGLMAGDRIVSVDDSVFVGKIVTNEETMRRLKGPKGSAVKLGIWRQGEKHNPLSFTIVRGDIPIKSIDAAYLISDSIGYIRINKFGETTYPEMMLAIARFYSASDNCRGFIVDLRGNTGGYMGAAIQMINEFLHANQLIVYTEGRKYPREEYRADGRGNCKQADVVVLIDESSASASEIFAGAIQDNDRGIVIGRRSFGKGLVQQPVEFRDGSALRLTIARYYTPSGRCIQKPYEKGAENEYNMDIVNRYEHGEFFSKDSIRQDESIKYYTSVGRVVYGGGGIMPDIFVPQDTTDYTSYYKNAAMRGLLLKFAFEYTDHHRGVLAGFADVKALDDYLRRQNLLEQFAVYAQERGLKRRNNMLQRSKKLFENAIYGNIIYNVKGLEEYIKYDNETDPTVQKALKVLKDKTEWHKLLSAGKDAAKEKRE